MVAIGFFEFGLGREALAVAQERTVAIGLEDIRELPKAEYLSLVLIVTQFIA